MIMRHVRRRISKMVDELINYMLSIEASDININISEIDNFYVISLKSNFSEEKSNKIEKLVKALNSPKTEEIEEYYWELAGESETGTELYLLAMMVDKSEIHIVGNTLDLKLYKSK